VAIAEYLQLDGDNGSAFQSWFKTDPEILIYFYS